MFPDVDTQRLDLRDRENCLAAAKDAREIYNLACDMGGMGFIETHKAECMISVLINTHMLMAARDRKSQRFFYSSSACVYAADKQTRPDVAPLTEGDAYPAMPEDGYGWEKLFSERMCRHFNEDFGLETTREKASRAEPYGAVDPLSRKGLTYGGVDALSRTWTAGVQADSLPPYQGPFALHFSVEDVMAAYREDCKRRVG